MRCKADYRPTPCLSVSLTDLPHLLVRQIWNVKPSFKTGDFQGSDGQKPAIKQTLKRGNSLFLGVSKRPKAVNQPLTFYLLMTNPTSSAYSFFTNHTLKV